MFAEGATVPFIARYRKEATGMLDEVGDQHLRTPDRPRDLDQAPRCILKSLSERNLLSDRTRAVNKPIRYAARDIYLPYRPKRRTRANRSPDTGLEPLADALLSHSPPPIPG